MNIYPSDNDLPEVSEADFEAKVLRCPQPALVSFQAPRSRYCEIFNLTLAEVAMAYGDKVKVFKVNSDAHRALVAQFEVEFVPTLLCFVNGAVRVRIVGMSSKLAILTELETALENQPPLVPSVAAAVTVPRQSNQL